MLNVAIVEDDDQIREGIRKYLSYQQDFICELAAESVEEFLARTKSGDYPDVILMDIGLPGMSGIDGMRFIKEQHPDVDIIMLTVYTDWQKIFDALRAGASGYLLKNTPLTEIKKGIESVHAGGAAMSPEIARKVLEHFSPTGGKTQPKIESPLTPKEKEIVVGLVDGLSYKMIADRMDISIDTIRFHIKNIYKKLQVNSKAEVISKSLRGEI
jgi:DNA-binding NarL/FixJ family response regulator